MSDKGPSLAGRAALAIILMAGFYAMAISIAVALFALPVLELLFADRLHVKLAVFAVGGGILILVSVLPRWDSFDPPGPELEEGRHPRLFAAIREVARATGQEMPAEVYAVPQVNAFVTQRGGIMGFFSKRVMGLGVPVAFVCEDGRTIEPFVLAQKLATGELDAAAWAERLTEVGVGDSPLA